MKLGLLFVLSPKTLVSSPFQWVAVGPCVCKAIANMYLGVGAGLSAVIGGN